MNPPTSEVLDAWAEISAKIGSRVLTSLYSEDERDSVLVTRISGPEGSEFTFTYPEPKPRKPWIRVLGEWLGLL